VIDVLGWYGLGVVVLAYGAVSLGFILPSSYTYQFMNLSGSFGLGAVAFAKRAYQNAVLNIVWAAVAVIALSRLIV
jgi:hypothetical protein